jgi:hypothetical protein
MTRHSDTQPVIPAHSLVRDVSFLSRSQGGPLGTDYRLVIWDTGKTGSRANRVLGYRLTDGTGAQLVSSKWDGFLATSRLESDDVLQRVFKAALYVATGNSHRGHLPYHQDNLDPNELARDRTPQKSLF